MRGRQIVQSIGEHFKFAKALHVIMLADCKCDETAAFRSSHMNREMLLGHTMPWEA